jgi:NADH dehydrogenase
MSKYPHVVIVGAGFGGLGVAEQIGPCSGCRYSNRSTQLSHIPAAPLPGSHFSAECRRRGCAHSEHFPTSGECELSSGNRYGHQFAGEKIQVDDREEISYDYLVLAGGATVNYFGTPGAAEYAFPLYSLMNAVKLRNQVMQRFEAADRDTTIIDDGALTFVVVGAGPTVVETAGALSDLFYNLLPEDYHQLATEKARIILIEMGQEVLAAFKENLRAYAKKELEDRGVEIRLGEAVAEVGPTSVKLKSGEQIKAHTLVWGGCGG